MLIQEGLSELKVIRKKLSKLASELQEHAAWSDGKRHPWGIKGRNQEYDVREAETAVRAKVQSYRDLVNRFLDIKKAIDRTNLETTITVAGKEMTLHEAILYKREVEALLEGLVNSVNLSVRRALQEVERYNQKQEVDEKKADVLYLFDRKEIDNLQDWLLTFLEEVDAKLQIANATTQLVGLEEKSKDE